MRHISTATPSVSDFPVQIRPQQIDVIFVRKIEGQSSHWKAIHRSMCKSLHRFQTSLEYQASPSHRRLDAFLLSHLLAEHGGELLRYESSADAAYVNEQVALLCSLLPHSNEEPPEICISSKSVRLPQGLIKSAYSRFGNNNFVIHSQLHPVAHGIFPLASSLFNHSCVPNAIVVYRFHGRETKLVIKVLNSVDSGEEVI